MQMTWWMNKGLVGSYKWYNDCSDDLLIWLWWLDENSKWYDNVMTTWWWYDVLMLMAWWYNDKLIG